MRNSLINFFCNKGHKGVQQLQNIRQHIHQHRLGGIGALTGLQTDLGDLNIPVAEHIPNKIIQLGNSDTQFKPLQVVRHFLSQGIDLGEDPLVLNRQILR